ncbi:MAG: hypothetical protein CR968_04215 [Flavobacteriia bacterium]|nr:MAG: hypothetical protein CR968_04215 [Flavobacteriia bacterium]
MTTQSTPHLLKVFIVIILILTYNCTPDDPSDVTPADPTHISPDINEDGKLNILILGTSHSINSSAAGFAANNIAEELNRILSHDKTLDLEVGISFEDIYQTKEVAYGLGQAGNVYNANCYAHSLMQYYYWPDGQADRLGNLAGQNGTQWDYVVVASDPYIVAKLPGYYALGVNKIVSKIAEGGAKPLLLMVWPRDEAITASMSHYEEFTYRTADHAGVDTKTVPAGLAWESLPSAKKDTATEHPTPNGAYLAAASVYAQLLNKSAKASDYVYDDEIADIVFTTLTDEAGQIHYTGERSFMSPFKSCDIEDSTLNYNHTGTSSENGILNGLQWIIEQSDRTLVNGGTPPIDFNYGRANTNFEPHKRYKIDPAQFDFSLGFPMQDNGNYGDVSMLYGLDKRYDDSNNGTDLGTALYMVHQSELPYARAIPVRTLYALIKEAIPSQSAYSDNWHMHGNLNKAIGAYMYTLLTGDYVLGEEPEDRNSNAWKAWMSHKIGYETAYTLMTLKGIPPHTD